MLIAHVSILELRLLLHVQRLPDCINVFTFIVIRPSRYIRTRHSLCHLPLAHHSTHVMERLHDRVVDVFCLEWGHDDSLALLVDLHVPV